MGAWRAIKRWVMKPPNAVKQILSVRACTCGHKAIRYAICPNKHTQCMECYRKAGTLCFQGSCGEDRKIGG